MLSARSENGLALNRIIARNVQCVKASACKALMNEPLIQAVVCCYSGNRSAKKISNWE